ncbi:uncharacterized protein LOC133832182 [Humulus lupulus]|uniref:uncharacterized protein LOC133832182 n=1 Tax=Humulus lupulus TaxID=3486 RepID=UPI002B4025EF|nr:uncharacterized protein LOC133832182 [Humulus lupulus]
MGERKFLGLESIREANEAIARVRARMIASQDRQKTYAVPKIRVIEFLVGNYVFLRVSPMKGVRIFRKKEKLRPRILVLLEILERIGQVTYRLALPPALSGVHNLFHVSMFRKYVLQLSHVLGYETLSLQEDLSYEEKSVQILDKKD